MMAEKNCVTCNYDLKFANIYYYRDSTYCATYIPLGLGTKSSIWGHRHIHPNQPVAKTFRAVRIIVVV